MLRTCRYLRNGFPPEVINSWASGTGFAGVIGSGLYMILSGSGLADQ